jgi:hypothetical protein
MKKTILVIALLQCVSGISYAEDSNVSNGALEKTRVNQVIEPLIPLDKNQINNEIHKEVVAMNFGSKIIRNCASFDNVRNKTDLKQCFQIAMISSLPFIMDGQEPDGNNGVLYSEWRNNYASIEEKKKIHSISSEKLNILLKKYNKCMMDTASAKTYYDLKVLKTEWKQKCTIKDNEILK